MFRAHYFDIVSERRIVCAYEMTFAGKRLSISLVTVTFEPVEGRTRMLFTEQATILDGQPGAWERRIIGTEDGMDRLVAIVEREPAGQPPTPSKPASMTSQADIGAISHKWFEKCLEWDNERTRSRGRGASLRLVDRRAGVGAGLSDQG